MARIRSPNYPVLSLPEAITRVGTIHNRERHLAAPKEVIAKHLGYGGLNGASIKAISALIKYGLLEEAGPDKMKVSALALSILHPRTPDEKSVAVREAASRPGIFEEISNEWPDGTPSDHNLRAWLVRRNFASDAIERVIQAYKETRELVTQESEGYDSAANLNKEPIMEPQTHHLQPMPITTAGAVLGSPRLGTTSVKIEDDRIEVSAVLLFQENIEDLISKLQAIKGLRPRAVDKRKGDQEPN